MKVSVKTTQLLEASVLGTLAFKNGLKRAPFYDTELNKFFAGRGVGETPKGEASSVAIMKAWTNAWDNANLANAWDKCNFSNKLQVFSQAIKQA
ncbi:hypothetical protein UFOVP615_19 [uncultured Caudovirales phage]|uniref:Uncharacterized protein n=1 Tax=uncultured Caudovirales phage TaxID=2100421 RepID=A0A6J5MZ75_9CAUD|nr:hypothetical protein UFOVP615_19 [uncultured Caudovirales phage]